MSTTVSRETPVGSPFDERETAGVASGRTPAASGGRRRPGATPAGSRASAQTVSRETNGSLPARVLLIPLRAYRRFLSPALGARCRYYPSCSAYAEQSLLELGAVRGTIVAAWRLMRCNPLTKGGFDELSDRRLFRSSGHSHSHAPMNGDLA